MNFWDFFNAHPIFGFVVTSSAIFGAMKVTSQALDVLNVYATALLAKWSSCDCEVCECPPGCHDDDSETENGGASE